MSIPEYEDVARYRSYVIDGPFEDPVKGLFGKFDRVSKVESERMIGRVEEYYDS